MQSSLKCAVATHLSLNKIDGADRYRRKDGCAVDTGDEILRRLVAQVSNPVRWDLCMDMMVSMGVTGLLELSPGGTLVGLAKRAMPGVAAVALKSPEDLDAAFALITEHGGKDSQ
jgi:[acyl-carrier-protein] S-malonyltransferase